MRQKYLLFFFFCFAFCCSAVAQRFVRGVVTETGTKAPISYVNVYYEGRGVGTMTNEKGEFALPYHENWHTIAFSCVGYVKKEISIKGFSEPLSVEMALNSKVMAGVKVSAKKKKYIRKGNPAVDLMRKVIAAKKRSDLTRRDYYKYDRYQKITAAFNEVTPQALSQGAFKKMPFLKEHVEVSPETGKLILPVSVDETMSEHIYRKDPKSEKDIVKAHKVTGLSNFFSTGDIMTTMLEDVFTDVNVYDDEVRLLRKKFVSPISTASAINFYRYFIADTVKLGNDSCYEITFTPNNPQDFGFSGTLYVVKDSTYRLRDILLQLPHNNGVNFLDDLLITQEFQPLSTGEQVLVSDKMVAQMNVVGSFTKVHVKRLTHYSNYSFREISPRAFKFQGNEIVETDAMMKPEEYWATVRPEELSEKETAMDHFLTQMRRTKGFRIILLGMKALVENFVETSSNPDKPSKVDIGPINTILSNNFVNGLRLRASAQTTAFFNPHLFLKGYAAYGFKDRKWEGRGEVTYSFNKKAYLPREFPVRNLTLSYQNDVMAPTDKFSPTDKDNVFTSLKWTDVDQMIYVKTFRLLYDHEWGNGLRLTTTLQHEKESPTAKLFYQRLSDPIPVADPSRWVNHMNLTDINVNLRYQPGAKYINTKQRRLTVNKDAPIFELSHTSGLKCAGNQVTYNLTEASVYKRFYIPASWGRINARMRVGAQWNRVPFPLLYTPEANLSYIRQEGMFSLVRNMEFFADRYLTVMTTWDMNGKIFNRIPLLRRLKWRESIGFNFLWGSLSDRNNPFLEKNQGDRRLFHFPGYFRPGGYESISTPLDRKRPYMEVWAGVHNIFKIIDIDCVRRLSYLSAPHVKKWGIRLRLEFTF